jgi:multiple sugar transport system permease protein
MPIISSVGSKSLNVRLVYGGLFAVLVLGAVTMIYPLLLMLSGSVKSAADYDDVSAYPAYWSDNAVLFQKYLESKYNGSIDQVGASWGRRVGVWNKIELPSQESLYLEDFLEWRPQCKRWWLGHTGIGKFLPVNSRLFRAAMQEKFHGDLDAFGQEIGGSTNSWNDVWPPANPNPLRCIDRTKPLLRAFDEFSSKRPIEDRVIINVDGNYLNSFVIPTYTKDIGEYNRLHGTSWKNYREVWLTRRAPPTGLVREDWEKFVREQLALDCIHINAKAEETFRHFIEKRYGDIAQYNSKLKTQYQSFQKIPLPQSVPENVLAQVDWADFLRDPALSAEALEVYGPRQAFEEFVAARRHISLESIVPLAMPVDEADLHDALANSGPLRREFATRNYTYVLDFVLLHGRGISNTAIYCLLAILTSLLVNPLAAYSLSRFKPPSTYAILLFCMATMAFPGEVTMIPSFLLQRRFPLWSLAGGIVAFAATWLILGRMKLKMSDTLRVLPALALALVVGVWAVPTICGDVHISLLNTFAALVLPGMANGFSIFLLKGFFDSLPQELYEAAEIDGAGEWTKFWTFTMMLSKPILAVIALSAFNGAYSAFMMALIVIPDPHMWTLMVWLYQLQSHVHPSVVYAALVISAIPTLLVFVFCQNLIMRGIVVPTEK